MPCDVNIYGPFSHTLFLGASIVRFSSRIGWNSEDSTCDVELVNDLCSSNKVYYACDGSAQIHNGPDSFTPPVLGAPVYFKFANFDFSGIIRNWKEVVSDKKTYSVSLSGPNCILDAVKVIIGGYTGDVLGVPNIINAYGFLEETYGSVCPVDASLYSLLGYYPALGFGGANRTEAGISWNALRTALIAIMNATPTALYSGKFGWMAQFKGISYYIDLSELPSTADDFRFSGDSLSLLDIINQVCEYAGLDWYSELVYSGTTACDTSEIHGFIPTDLNKYIKIQVVARVTQPSSAAAVDNGTGYDINTRLNLGDITSFLTANNVSNVSRGIELRTETTNAMLVGGARQDIWQVAFAASGDDNSYTNTIWPYWGKDANGYPIISQGYNDKHNFNISIKEIWDDVLDTVISGTVGWTYNVEAGELSAILDEGGVSSWYTYIESQPNKTAYSQLLNIIPDGNVYAGMSAKGAQWALKADNIRATSYWDATKASSVSTDPDLDFGDRLYNRLEGFANEYFGKKFMVFTPIICATYDSDQPYTIKTNWIKSDGGWTEANVLDLSPGTNIATDQLELFRLPDGRIQCILKFDADGDRINMTNWDASDYYQPQSDIVYVKATVEEIIFLDPVNALYPRAVVSIDKPIISNQVYIDNEKYGIMPMLGLLSDMPPAGDKATRMKFANHMVQTPGGDINTYGYYPTPLIPVAAAVPLKSTILRYGPWYAGSPAAAGNTEYEVNDDLTPWTYGNIATMNVVGQMMIDNRVLNQQVIELGDLTVAGAPAYSLGEYLAVGSPEITNIDVAFDIGGVTTSYQMRTFTPDYNTFGKTRTDNIRKTANQLRHIQRLNSLARINQIRNPESQSSLGTVLNREDRYKRASAHSFMLAHTFNDYDPSPGLTMDQVSGVDQLVITDRVISPVVNTDLRKALPQFGAGSGDAWLYRAGMETQGMFRPYTTLSGSLSLMPEFATGIPIGFEIPENPELMYNYSNNRVYQFRGPVFNEALPPIMCATLNPFMQASDSGGLNTSYNIDIYDQINPYDIYFTMGSGYGHDIEYVVRDGVYPLDLSIKYPDINYSKNGWYRGIGLKGPPVIVGWGYDIYGKPTPNFDEIPGSGGKSCKFADDWLNRPDLWKAGPLDIRWDHRRGVWTSPPSYRIVRIKMLESSLGWNTSLNAEIVDDYTTAYNNNGEPLKNKYISLKNPVGYLGVSGVYGWAIFDPTIPGGAGYGNYQLLISDDPIFYIRTTDGYEQSSLSTYVGTSGTIIRTQPSFTGWDKFGTVFIRNAIPISGYDYTCDYFRYDEANQRHEFIPRYNPMFIEGGEFNGTHVSISTRPGFPSRLASNPMNLPSGSIVIVEWNGLDQFIIINSTSYDTPVSHL